MRARQYSQLLVFYEEITQKKVITEEDAMNRYDKEVISYIKDRNANQIRGVYYNEGVFKVEKTSLEDSIRDAENGFSLHMHAESNKVIACAIVVQVLIAVANLLIAKGANISIKLSQLTLMNLFLGFILFISLILGVYISYWAFRNL